MRKNNDIVIPMKQTIPIVIGVFMLAGLMIGGSLFFALRGGFAITNPIEDEGLMLSGSWKTQSLTYNDEFVTISFNGEFFTMITETNIADGDITYIYSHLAEIGEFYAGVAEVEDLGNGNVLLRVTVRGTFVLTGNEIWLSTSDNIVTIHPFSWTGAEITINNDNFTRVDSEK
ncbi:MAG: hypothetical protein FWC89_02835 [Defluviitaleaceae bacterium]|nr:hypothetical protein [Defluviitaleaceae bacterium]